MNRIYKVIWSKVKHQYVVVSELAHSNGKQSRTARKSLRSRIAALVVCGAVAAFGVYGALPTQQAFAANMPNGTMAELDEYIAFNAKDVTELPDGYELVEVEDKNDPARKARYYVKEGYSIEGTFKDKLDGTGETFVITKVYAPNGDFQDTLTNTGVAVSGSGFVTNSGKEINLTDAGNYTAVSNGGALGIDATDQWHYFIDTGDKWENVGLNKKRLTEYFKTVGTDKTGLVFDEEKQKFTYNGEVVNSENIYSIKIDDSYKLGVFVVDGKVYTSTVYGNTGEILTTHKNEDGSLTTYWSAKADSDDVLLKNSNMTVGHLNDMFDEREKVDIALQQSDINKITVTPNENGNSGTLGLLRNEKDENENPIAVDGAISVEGVGGTNGQNTGIKFSQKNADGQDIEGSAFTLNTGSIVEGNVDNKPVNESLNKGALSNININGEYYSVATASAGQDNDTVTITQGDTTFNVTTTDYFGAHEKHIATSGDIKDSDTGEKYTGIYEVGTDGIVNLTEVNGNGEATENTLQITGIANKTALDKLDDFAVKYDKNSSDDTKPDYHSVTLGYENEVDYNYNDGANPRGGTRLYNVAYADDNLATTDRDRYGSQAVNVDYLNDKIAASQEEMSSQHTTMTVNDGKRDDELKETGTEGVLESDYTDGNLQLKQTVTDGQIQYDVKLNDDITLGDLEGNYIQVTGTKGTMQVANDSGFTNINGSTVTISADNGTGKSIVISDNGIDRTMSGLSNTTWSADFADQVANSEELQSVVATQGQLQSAIQQAGESATKSDFYLQNGTTNLGTDSEGNQITVSGQTTGYKADENGNIDMTVANENGENKHVVITDVASAAALNQLDSLAVKYDSTDKNMVTLLGPSYNAQTNEGGTKITNVARGEKPSDAVNYSQLTEVDEKVNAGWIAKDSSGKEINVNPTNNTLTFNGDENINVTAENNAINVSLEDDITLGEKRWDENYVDLSGTNGTLAVNNIAENGNEKTIHTVEFNQNGATFSKEEGFVGDDGVYYGETTKTVIDGGTVTVSKGDEGTTVIDGATITTDKVTGLANTEWSDKIANDVAADKLGAGTGAASIAATQGQLKDVADIAGSAADEAAKHTTIKKGDNNLDIIVGENDNGGLEYTIGLNDTIQLGNGNIIINGENGIISAKNAITIGDTTTLTNGKLIGLANVEWNSVKTRTDEDLYDPEQAATQGQLDDLYDSVVGYDVINGQVDKSSITLGGALNYNSANHSDGTHIYNVAYANSLETLGGDTNKFGSQAVNVDYLNDTIANSASSGEIAENEKHLATNNGATADKPGTTYAPDTDGKVTINEVNGNGEGTGNSVVISNVASKSELDTVKEQVAQNITDISNIKESIGDQNYNNVEGTVIGNGDTVTDAIGKLDNKIDQVGQSATAADNNTITGGKINADGSVTLTTKDEETPDITLDGKLSDSILDTVDDSKLKSDGEITLTSHDKYDPTKTESVTLKDIASKTNLDNLSSTVGATTTEELKESYKDTTYINKAETMVDADVALDSAINRNNIESINRDMYLDNRINNVESRLSDVEDRIDKVGAMAAAIANLRTMGYDPEAPTEIAVGVGQYKSETGLALGIFHYPNQDFMLSASISTSGDEVMGGIGATWKLGRKSAEERAKDEEERILAKAEEIKQAAKRAEVKAQADRHAQLLAEREAAGEPIRPVEEA